MEHKIKFYITLNGENLFDEWLESLDFQDSQKVLVRLSRLNLGNLSNCKSIGQGLHELKMDIGPGYRVYFSNIKMHILIILCAGSKRTQAKDISKAKEYLKDYKMRGK